VPDTNGMKELTAFALVYNLVRVVRLEAAKRQGVALEREKGSGTIVSTLYVDSERVKTAGRGSLGRAPLSFEGLKG
jgi:hypothetical protein